MRLTDDQRRAVERAREVADADYTDPETFGIELGVAQYNVRALLEVIGQLTGGAR